LRAIEKGVHRGRSRTKNSIAICSPMPRGVNPDNAERMRAVLQLQQFRKRPPNIPVSNQSNAQVPILANSY